LPISIAVKTTTRNSTVRDVPDSYVLFGGVPCFEIVSCALQNASRVCHGHRSAVA
jgi:hypothetical protein